MTDEEMRLLGDDPEVDAHAGGSADDGQDPAPLVDSTEVGPDVDLLDGSAVDDASSQSDATAFLDSLPGDAAGTDTDEPAVEPAPEPALEPAVEPAVEPALEKPSSPAEPAAAVPDLGESARGGPFDLTGFLAALATAVEGHDTGTGNVSDDLRARVAAEYRLLPAGGRSAARACAADALQASMTSGDVAMVRAHMLVHDALTETPDDRAVDRMSSSTSPWTSETLLANFVDAVGLAVSARDLTLGTVPAHLLDAVSEAFRALGSQDVRDLAKGGLDDAMRAGMASADLGLVRAYTAVSDAADDAGDGPARDESPDGHVDALDGPVVRGHLEVLEEGWLSGWATLVLGGRPAPSTSVRVVGGNGELVAEGPASDFRQDVLDAGMGSAWCGFALEVPSGAIDDTRTLILEVNSPAGWVECSRLELAVEPSASTLRAVPLLASFAQADAHGGVVGRRGLKFGTGLWLQVASEVVDGVRAALHLVRPDGGQAQDLVPVVRLEPIRDVSGRADLRFNIGRHSSVVEGGWLVVRVYGRSGAQQPVRVNLFDHTGRTGLGDFVVRSHQWSTLHVKLPQHTCQTPPTTEEGGALWLELVLDARASIDIAGPEVVADRVEDAFECMSVQSQSAVLTAQPARPLNTMEPFSVVIPFFGKAAYTAACVNSVLSCSWSPPEIILIDDGSPHRRSVERILEQFPGQVRVIRVASNRGYTAGVNTGVRAAVHDVVVILNNDTRVTSGWDIALREALTDPAVFAAGPLSNAASYQSVPELRTKDGWAVNALPADVTPDALASALQKRFSGRQLPLPVLNGFCYALRRADFLRLGGLDEEAFPSGYGEEVDLMMRAHDAGMRTVVTPASFVYHYKSITFGAQRAGLSKRGNAVVQERWGSALALAVKEMDADEAFDRVRAEVAALLKDLELEGNRG